MTFAMMLFQWSEAVEGNDINDVNAKTYYIFKKATWSQSNDWKLHVVNCYHI